MADPSEASPSSLVIHSPSPDVFNSMKHTLGCLVMVSARKLKVDQSVLVLMGGIHEVFGHDSSELTTGDSERVDPQWYLRYWG